MTKSQVETVGLWIYSTLPLSLILLAPVWLQGGRQQAIVLACGWLAEALIAYLASRRNRSEGPSSLDHEIWASLQIKSLTGGLSVASAFYLARGVELPVEDPSLIKWLTAMSPILAAFFALTAGSLWLSMILLGRNQGWIGSGPLVKVVLAAALGFFAMTWPLLALRGLAIVDEHFFFVGGLGSGASVVSFLVLQIGSSHKVSSGDRQLGGTHLT